MEDVSVRESVLSIPESSKMEYSIDSIPNERSSIFPVTLRPDPMDLDTTDGDDHFRNSIRVLIPGIGASKNVHFTPIPPPVKAKKVPPPEDSPSTGIFPELNSLAGPDFDSPLLRKGLIFQQQTDVSNISNSFTFSGFNCAVSLNFSPLPDQSYGFVPYNKQEIA